MLPRVHAQDCYVRFYPHWMIYQLVNRGKSKYSWGANKGNDNRARTLLDEGVKSPSRICQRKCSRQLVSPVMSHASYRQNTSNLQGQQDELLPHRIMTVHSISTIDGDQQRRGTQAPTTAYLFISMLVIWSHACHCWRWSLNNLVLVQSSVYKGWGASIFSAQWRS